MSSKGKDMTDRIYVSDASASLLRDEKSALLFMHLMFMKKNDAGQVDVTVRALSELTGFTRWAVEVALKSILSLGFIDCEKSGKKSLITINYDRVFASDFTYAPYITRQLHNEKPDNFSTANPIENIEFSEPKNLYHQTIMYPKTRQQRDNGTVVLGETLSSELFSPDNEIDPIALGNPEEKNLVDGDFQTGEMYITRQLHSQKPDNFEAPNHIENIEFMDPENVYHQTIMYSKTRQCYNSETFDPEKKIGHLSLRVKKERNKEKGYYVSPKEKRKPLNDDLFGFSGVDMPEQPDEPNQLITAKPLKPKIDKDQALEAFEQFRTTAKEAGLTVPSMMNAEREKRLLDRLEDVGGLEGWQYVLEKVRNARTPNGQIPKSWLNFDFVVHPSKFLKLMDGNYDQQSDNQPAKSLVDQFAEIIASYD